MNHFEVKTWPTLELPIVPICKNCVNCEPDNTLDEPSEDGSCKLYCDRVVNLESCCLGEKTGYPHVKILDKGKPIVVEYLKNDPNKYLVTALIPYDCNDGLETTPWYYDLTEIDQNDVDYKYIDGKVALIFCKPGSYLVTHTGERLYVQKVKGDTR